VGKHFVNFLPAVSKDAITAMGREIRSWHIARRSDKSLEDLARMFNPHRAGLDQLLRVQRARAMGSEGGGLDGLIALCSQARLRQRVEVPSR
jgi:hypothetical protein